MTTFYVSFAVGSTLADHYSTIEASDEPEARRTVIDELGRTGWYTVTADKSDIYTEDKGVTWIPWETAVQMVKARPVAP